MMNEYPSNNDQKKRRDKFFCQLAHGFFEEAQSEKDGWVVVPEAAVPPVMSEVNYSEGEIEHYLERLAEDGWIEVKDLEQPTPTHVRLTLVGKARAQVICKAASFD